MSLASRSEQNLKEAYARVNDFADSLQLPHIIKQTAKEILRQFEKKRDKHMKGFKKDAFIVAVILVACKQEQGGRTLKSIAKTTNIDEKDIKKFYKVLIRDNSIANIGTQGRKSIEEQTKDLIESFCPIPSTSKPKKLLNEPSPSSKANDPVPSPQLPFSSL
jgi:transcription initiation factor TFIIIB Brf1 subunit/transcription initiation factor TFIIB